MGFQIHALPAERFRHLFEMTAEQLEAVDARRVTVTSKPGYPCRISLEDAEPGEAVILTHFEHQPEPSPFRASHAIYVRSGVAQARPRPNEVPDVFRSRLISVRAFDSRHFIVNADVVAGTSLEGTIEAMLRDPAVGYVHLHNAQLGCYTARATRVED